MVEHSLGKGEVTSSILVIGSRDLAVRLVKRFGRVVWEGQFGKGTASAVPMESKESGFSRRESGSNSVVESQPSKLLVAGSIPVSRSRIFFAGKACVSGYQQAVIRIEHEKEYQELKGAIERAVSPEKMKQFLKRVESSGIRVREVEAVLAKGLLEKVDESLAKSGKTAQQLYEALTVSDQAQLREFYLSKIEEIEPALRAKFQKLYSYY